LILLHGFDTTTTEVKGNIWVTWQLLTAAGEDSWWWRISSSSSADYFNGRFVFAFFLFVGVRAKI
jgi:hypothetical protein